VIFQDLFRRCLKMTDAHNAVHAIAGAMEQYGGSAVSDVVVRFGNQAEIAVFFDVEAGIKLQKITRYKTSDEVSFVKKDEK
jgi:hypothetical protein